MKTLKNSISSFHFSWPKARRSRWWRQCRARTGKRTRCNVRTQSRVPINWPWRRYRTAAKAVPATHRQTSTRARAIGAIRSLSPPPDCPAAVHCQGPRVITMSLITGHRRRCPRLSLPNNPRQWTRSTRAGWALPLSRGPRRRPTCPR